MNTKKYGRFLFVLIAFALLLPTPFVKAEGKSIVGATTVYESQRGKIVKANLYIHGNEKIAGGSLDLLYDKTALTVQKAEIGDQLSDYITSVNTEQAGKVSLTWAKGAEQQQEGTLLTLTVRLEKADETTALDLQDVKLYGEDFSTIAVDAYDGDIKPFKGDKKKNSSKVKGDKEWTIRFNTAFNPATVNNHTVRVKDSRGNEIDVSAKVRDNNVIVISPKSDYARGTYTLEITEQVRALNGSKLKQPVQYEFSVE